MSDQQLIEALRGCQPGDWRDFDRLRAVASERLKQTPLGAALAAAQERVLRDGQRVELPKRAG